MIDYLEELMEGEEAAALLHKQWVVPGKPRPGSEGETVSAPPNTRKERSVLSAPAGGQTEAEGENPVDSPASFWADVQAEEGERVPLWEEVGQAGGGTVPLLQALNRARRLSRMTGAGQGTVTVTLPGEGGQSVSGLGLSELDRAVERDARRYDSGFSLY